jgi:hypothetical protein
MNMKNKTNIFCVSNCRIFVATVIMAVVLIAGGFVSAQQLEFVPSLSVEDVVGKHFIKYSQPPRRIPADV